MFSAVGFVQCLTHCCWCSRAEGLKNCPWSPLSAHVEEGFQWVVSSRWSRVCTTYITNFVWAESLFPNFGMKPGQQLWLRTFKVPAIASLRIISALFLLCLAGEPAGAWLSIMQLKVKVSNKIVISFSYIVTQAADITGTICFYPHCHPWKLCAMIYSNWSSFERR